MKEEALELADELKDVADVLGSNNIEATVIGKGADMIRKLVAELDAQADRIVLLERRFGEELDAHHSAKRKIGKLKREMLKESR